ncbi:hypothetical protein BJ741DRAFT_604153 [Chytriomyces cf. hyalinus JEL632]|nr:hypothetical protein BJ741DRAFT_604153 [Chytriomyces cf. hyalinus JEL632]
MNIGYPDPANAPVPPKGKSARGRKPKAPNEVGTKKQIQDRLAQRAHRERQAQYVASLEKRAEDLAALVAAERKRSAGLDAHIAVMRADLDAAKWRIRMLESGGTSNGNLGDYPLAGAAAGVALSKEASPVPVVTHPDPVQSNALMYNLVPPLDEWQPQQSFANEEFDSDSDSDDNADMEMDLHIPDPIDHPSPTQTIDEWFDEVRRNSATAATAPNGLFVKSANDLYGPPQVEFARDICRSIPCLQDCRYVDDIFNVFVLQAKTSDVKLIEKYIVRIVSCWYKILDALKDAPQSDRKAIYDLDEIFKVINQDHMNHFYVVAASAATKLEKIKGVPRYSNIASPIAIDRASLRAAITAIPSLQHGCDDLIEELCQAYQTKRNFFKISVIIGMIQNKCENSDDRASFLSALHTWRISHNELQDASFNEVLSALESVSIS